MDRKSKCLEQIKIKQNKIVQVSINGAVVEQVMANPHGRTLGRF